MGLLPTDPEDGGGESLRRLDYRLHGCERACRFHCIDVEIRHLYNDVTQVQGLYRGLSVPLIGGVVETGGLDAA